MIDWMKRLEPVVETEIRVVVGDRVRVVVSDQTEAWEQGDKRYRVEGGASPLVSAVKFAARRGWAATEFLEVGQLSRAEIARMLKGEGG